MRGLTNTLYYYYYYCQLPVDEETPRSGPRTFTIGLTDFLPTIRASFSTKRFLSDLKCTKIAGGWGSAPDPAGGAYSTPPAVRRFERGKKGGKGGEREERGG